MSTAQNTQEQYMSTVQSILKQYISSVQSIELEDGNFFKTMENGMAMICFWGIIACNGFAIVVGQQWF